jgi:hypothetical protein
MFSLLLLYQTERQKPLSDLRLLFLLCLDDDVSIGLAGQPVQREKWSKLTTVKLSERLLLFQQAGNNVFTTPCTFRTVD